MNILINIMGIYIKKCNPRKTQTQMSSNMIMSKSKSGLPKESNFCLILEIQNNVIHYINRMKTNKQKLILHRKSIG